MRRILILIFTIFLTFSAIGQEKKVLRGFDGGMMLHTGYLSGKIPGIGFSAKGAPLGIGGVARLCLGSHFRVGGEGYVSTLHQLRNGSYVKYGWGGLLADYSHRIGRFVPYAGLTIGGGSASGLIINEFSGEEWGELQDASYGKQAFFALDHFLGCEYVLTERIHLTAKLDWLLMPGKAWGLPDGPRIYFGFIFCH